MTPTLECVAQTGVNKYSAYFGYKNTTSNFIIAPIGPNNGFNPTPLFRGQPPLFIPFHIFLYPDVAFVTSFDGNTITWTLNNTSVSASRTSARCPTGH